MLVSGFSNDISVKVYLKCLLYLFYSLMFMRQLEKVKEGEGENEDILNEPVR